MIDVEVVQLLVSPAHRLAGRPSEGPAPGPDDERAPRCGRVWGWWETATSLRPRTGTPP
ncbi:hypothetical protein [Streptomyces sp. E1N211]|uniref:hypothetical protein n=1 Tax=Streptomyces sp. E1N211 TaxID=1851876 RepID=UPI0031F659C8